MRRTRTELDDLESYNNECIYIYYIGGTYAEIGNFVFEKRSYGGGMRRNKYVLRKRV